MSLATDIHVDRMSPRRKVTYQDVITAPENWVAEIIGNELFLMPRPTRPHLIACTRLARKIGGPFEDDDDPGGWMFIGEPEVRISGNILVPDIAGWRTPRDLGDPDIVYTTVIPDWICEVLSPSTRALDLGPKREIYADHGVGYLWFVDPTAKSLQAFELKDGDWISTGLATGQEMVSRPPFDAISFRLDWLWGKPKG